VKNLFENSQSKKFSQWPLIKTVFNIGAVWIIQLVLNEEEKLGTKKESLVTSN
jgi:hypothetical protein